VIIPAYNAARHIGSALDSVAAQTLPPAQVVVVDDGSRDETCAVVRAWAARHPLRVDLVSVPNGGAGAARNEGFRHAMGELVAFLDADDHMHRHHLQTLVEPFGQCPDLVLSFGVAEVRDLQDRLVRVFPDARVNDVVVGRGAGGVEYLGGPVYASLIAGSYVGVSATLLSRAAAAKIGYMDRRFRQSEDREFFLRLCRVGRFAFVRNVVATKRDHDDNTTHSRHRYRTARSTLRMLDMLCASTARLGLSADETRATRDALRETLGGVIYLGSRRGLWGYAATWIDLAWSGHAAHLFQLKPWLRALACTADAARASLTGGRRATRQACPA
jgi:GT2 family glycosyltransferase